MSKVSSALAQLWDIFLLKSVGLSMLHKCYLNVVNLVETTGFAHVHTHHWCFSYG